MALIFQWTPAEKRIRAVWLLFVFCGTLSMAGCLGPEASMQRGNIAYRNGQPQQAVRHYQEALKSPETRAAASFNLGKIILQQGDAQRAKDYLDQALELELEYPLVRVYHGRALLALGQTDEARSDFERVLKTKRSVPEANIELGKILAAEENYAEAAQVVQPARESPTHVEEATLLAAAWHREAGELATAIDELETLLSVSSYRIPTYFRLAEYLAEDGDFREAERRFRAGLRLEPANVGGALGLASVLQAQGEFKQARQIYEAVAAGGSSEHPLVQQAKEALRALPSQSQEIPGSR